jgi:hypothetical protein
MTFAMPIKEDSIPVDKRGQPDLSRYPDSVEYYAEMYERFIAIDGAEHL